MKAVLYAAKSTLDTKGSIRTQLEDGRAIAADRGWEVAGEFEDEAKSAYHGSRGDGLTNAMALCEQLAPSVLIVQHSDRLARGDAKQARHLIEIVLWAIKTEVSLVSVQDPEMLAGGDMALLMGAIGGMRNHEDSRRKSKSVRDGLQRRKERGQPVGVIPFGYMHRDRKDENGETMRDNGKPLTERVPDPELVPEVKWIFSEVASGKTTLGGVARALNARDVTTRPRKDNPQGTPFVARTIRLIIGNDAYIGGKGYPAIVESELAESARNQLLRRDPVAVQRGKGGRLPKRPYLLRSVVFCARCGAPMYSTRAYGRAKVGAYACSNKLQNTGKCHAPAIRAELLETHVLNHLGSFVGAVEGWITDNLTDRSTEREARKGQLEVERRRLADLDARRDDRLAEIEKHGITSPIAMEVIERIDRQRDEQSRQVARVEASLAEWDETPDVDGALDFYNALADAIQRQVTGAAGVKELNETLCTVLAGLWCEVEQVQSEPSPTVNLFGIPSRPARRRDHRRLLVQFALRKPTTIRLPDGSTQTPDRLWLPPASLGYQPIDPLQETGSQTTVSACFP